jgi:Bacterial transcriptional regulator
LQADITAMVTDLAEVTGSRVRFGVWHERGVSALTHPGGRRRGVASLGTELLPAHATALGKAMLAFAPASEVRRVLGRSLTRYTSRTLTTPDALRRALATTRARGRAVAMREFGVDEWALAVPVFARNALIASLEVSGTDSLSELKSLTPALQYGARALGRGLAEHPIWLPTGTGRTPLRWPIDLMSLAADDEEAQVTLIAAVGGDTRQAAVRPTSAGARHPFDKHHGKPDPTSQRNVDERNPRWQT